MAMSKMRTAWISLYHRREAALLDLQKRVAFYEEQRYQLETNLAHLLRLLSQAVDLEREAFREVMAMDWSEETLGREREKV